MFAGEDAWYNQLHATKPFLDNSLFVDSGYCFLVRFFPGLETDCCSSYLSFANAIPAGR